MTRLSYPRRQTMPLALIVAIASIGGAPSVAAERTYPGAQWQSLAAPEKLGWSRERLQPAHDYARSIDTAAVMVIVDGQVLDEWGPTDRRFNVHSIRKSLLSAMYGVRVRAGTIDLKKSMADLGIDDNEPSLTKVEKQATLHDLLRARSGVYHPALYETARMKAARPARGSHAPGEFWYYNNWDFNVLGVVFERETKTNLFQEFQKQFADPLQMQDFRVADCAYVTGADSVYPAYPFRLSARDMARFGLLFLRDGTWNGKQIVPADWVKESTTSYSDAGDRGGYGYLWWIEKEGRHLPGVKLPAGSYSARGAHGHYILIVPELDLVIVHRVDSDIPGREVTAAEFGKLVGLILAAHYPKPPVTDR